MNTTKGWFIINSDNNTNYTQEMEKAMSQNHKMSVVEYESKFANKMKVEQRREREYQESKQIIAEFDSQLRK